MKKTLPSSLIIYFFVISILISGCNEVDFSLPSYINSTNIIEDRYCSNLRLLPISRSSIDSIGSFSRMKIFRSGHGGYKRYRIPVLFLTSQNTLLAFSEGRNEPGRDDGDIDIVMKRSTDGGVSWSSLTTILEDGDYTIGNQTIVEDKNNGVLHMLYCKENWEVYHSKSFDDGKSWTPGYEITEEVKLKGWTWYATGPGNGIQLTSGRLVIPAYHKNVKNEVRSHSLYSDNGGINWNIGGLMPNQTNENVITEIEEGVIYINSRNNIEKKRVNAVSYDEGLTWENASFNCFLPDPVCHAGLTQLEDSTRKLLIFTNLESTENRENLQVKLSFDGGDTWSYSKPIYTNKAAYSSLASSQDGTIYCLFEKDNYKSLEFVKFNIEWISDGEVNFK